MSAHATAIRGVELSANSGRCTGPARHRERRVDSPGPGILRACGFAAGAFVLGVASFGCNKSDVGKCCVAFAGSAAVVPVPDPNATVPADIIRVDPGFDCEALSCVLYEGSPEAYCTERCQDDGDCPADFVCRPVLDSQACDENMSTPDPGDDCDPGSLTTDQKFCVRPAAGGTPYDCETAP